jgi:predicted ATPase
MSTERWSDEIGQLRVRMAVHTGIVELQDGDYFGQPVNRVARIMSAGHGGQILLSMSAQELVRDHLPLDVSLRDMGEHRLKDLIRPEHLFQVISLGLPAEFPPLRTLDSSPNNLPLQPTPLIGREKELAAIEKLLEKDDVRLLTLVGPGGTGKTRLGLQTAADLMLNFRDGVYFVNLAPISDPNLVVSEIAQTLNVRESGAPGETLLQSLKAHLREKQYLLVLDNFEQLLEASPVVSELLSVASQLKVLVTSRSRLQVRGEQEYPVPPLQLPDPKRLPAPERLTQFESVRLFIERARNAKPDFHISDENAPAVAEICYRLDGLPLAIELAAARVKLLAPQAMLSRLQSSLKLLTAGARDLPARQQTLRNAIAWSFDLLDEQEKMLFRRLSIFVGGRSLEAIETICNANSDLEVDLFDHISSLVDKSLLRQEEGADAEPRFVMLETIHEYARETLQEAGEVQALSRLHAEYFVTLAETAAPELWTKNQEAWLPKLEEEHDNFRAALRWAVSECEIELALRLVGALWHFWEIHGHIAEALTWFDEVLPLASGDEGLLLAEAYTGKGTTLWRLSDFPGALGVHRLALQLYMAAADKAGMAFALNNCGVQLYCLEQWNDARECFEESINLYAECNPSTRGWPFPRLSLSEIQRLNKDFAAAREQLMETLRSAGKLIDTFSMAITLQNLGHIELRLGASEHAIKHFTEVTRLSVQLNNDLYRALALYGFAGVAAVQNEPLRAALFFGAGDAALERIPGLFLEPSDKADYDYNLELARGQIDDTRWQSAYEEGRRMSLEQAAGYALQREISEGTESR